MHMIVGNIVNPSSYKSTASQVNLCKDRFVKVYVIDGAIPTITVLTPGIVCNSYGQRDVNSLTADVKYKAVSTDGLDTDTITLHPE